MDAWIKLLFMNSVGVVSDIRANHLSLFLS